MPTNTNPDFVIKQGDVLPVLNDTLTYSDGTVANLTGATVQFVTRSMTSSAVTTNAAATIVSPTAGTVSYTFTATDTATAGQYLGVWIVTFSGGLQQTWPTDGYLDIWVEQNLTSDTSQYLVSLPDLKDHLNIPASDRTRDQKLIRWVEAARPVVEGITGPIVPTVYDELYDGGNWFIRTRHRPIIRVLACDMYLGPIDYPMANVQDASFGSIFSVEVDSGHRVVRRSPGGGVLAFPSMPQCVHLVYQAGRTTIPENIRQATLIMIQENWEATQTPGGPHSGPYGEPPDERVPAQMLVSPRVRELIVPNRRHPSVF